MKNENQVPAGSEPVNPLPDNSPEQAVTPAVEPEVQQAEPVAQDNPTTEPKEDPTAKFEQMMAANQKMIGKQASEIGALRAKLDEMSKPHEPAGPSEDEQLNAIYEQMDSGELDIADGMRQALAINSRLTTSQVMSQLNEQQRQSETAKIQTKFLEDNPDYDDVLSSGELDKYMQADPLADEYVAFKAWKFDQEKQALQQSYEEKIKAAKEEGAKLAKGAESAGKVIGRQGGSAAAPPTQQRPFKNNQEASAAMMDTLKQMRSSAAQ